MCTFQLPEFLQGEGGSGKGEGRKGEWETLG